MNQNKSPRFLDIAIMVVALLMVAYHLISTQTLLLGIQEHNAAHLAFGLLLASLSSLKVMKRRWMWFLPMIVAIGGVMVCVYMIFNSEYLRVQTGFISRTIDWVMGWILILVVFEAAREAWGWWLAGTCAIFVPYFFFGQYLPYPLHHAEFAPEYVLSNLGIGWRGIFEYLEVSANFMFLFVVLGGVLGAIGAPKFFGEAGKTVGKFLAGGAAQTSVVSSALVGMVMGQAVSNAIVVGTFTIPLMKKAGYTPEEAGAIEATASSGGQIMPPIMGESVFLMSTLIGVSYFALCLMSIIPAVFYFLSIAFGVQVLAYRGRITSQIEKVNWSELLTYAPVFLVPLGTLIVLLMLRFSPMYCAFYAIIVAVVAGYARKKNRPSLGEMAQGFTRGAVAGAGLCVAVAVVGLLTQTMVTTGIGMLIASTIEQMSMGNLWLCLVITMIISLILGIGLPTLPAYVLVALVVAPVLVKMGVSLVAAHLFCFWFAVFSTLTPPVAFAPMATSAIAGGDFNKTSWVAFRLAISSFILPYLLIFNPILLLQPQPLLEGILALIAITAGLAVLQVVLYRHFFVPTPIWEWLLFILSAVGLLGFCFFKNYIFFGVGILLFVVLTYRQWRKKPKLERVEIAEKLQPG